MKMGPGTLGTVENEFGSTKHANGTQRTRYCPKKFSERKIGKRVLTPWIPPKTRPGEEIMKTGPDALGTVEN
jgi:hypothetical protein